MVERVVVATQPVAIEYGVTRMGRTLRPPTQAMVEWFVDHLAEVTAARSGYDEQCPSR